MNCGANCAKSVVTREGFESAVKGYVVPEVGIRVRGDRLFAGWLLKQIGPEGNVLTTIAARIAPGRAGAVAGASTASRLSFHCDHRQQQL